MSSKISFDNIYDYNLNQNLFNNKDILFPNNIGEGKITILDFNNGISLHYFDVKVKEDFILENKFEKKLFSFTTFLEGNMQYQNIDFNFDKTFNTNTMIVTALNKENGLSYYKKGNHIKCINICVDEIFFNNLREEGNQLINENLEKLNKGPFFSVISELSCTFNTLEMLNNLFNNSLNKNFQYLYLQSKIYEFLYENFNRLNQSKKNILSRLDEEYILNVKEYILNNLYKELTLKELAKVARSNESYLQKNFKLFFNTTVFKFILEQRMEKAKLLLSTNEYSIQEVANLVGYKYQSNFSTAFFKRFKKLPKSYQKSIKIYI